MTANPFALPPLALKLGLTALAFAAAVTIFALVNGPATPAGGAGEVTLDSPADPLVAQGDALYQQARETGDPAYLERAERAYDSALAADPASIGALSGKATLALSRHDFDGGLALAQQAHRIDPDASIAYPSLVDGLIETGRYGAAGSALDRMVALKPNLASYTRVSYYRELHGDLAGAAQALRFAISAGAGTIEGSAYVRSLLGDLEASRGRYGAAESAYRDALATDPAFGPARVGLALLAAGRGEYGAAIAELREQLGQPRSPDTLTELGEVEEAAGRLAAARRHYAAAAAIEEGLLRNGSNADAGVTLSFAEHGDPARAVELGRRAWRTAPSVSAADAYSLALLQAGRVEAASRISAEAMRLGSRDPEFLYHAGLIARADGRLGQARQLLGTLVAQNPSFSPLYGSHAQQVLTRLG